LLEVYEIDKARTYLDDMVVYEGRHKFRRAIFRAFVAMRSREGPKQAREILDALLEWLGPDPDYYMQLAEAYLEVPDRPKALEILAKSQPMPVPERLRFRYNILRAQALQKLNQFEEVGRIIEHLEPDIVGPPEKRGSLVEMFLGLKDV